MDDKTLMIALLRDEFNRWEALLAGLSEEQIITRSLPSDLSIKDVIAHLRAWQQVSIARLEAALQDRDPAYPAWTAGLPPDSEENLENFNERINLDSRAQPWASVHQTWKDGFLRFLELAGAIPEADLLEVDRYPWIEGYALFGVLQGCYEHHHEDHLEPLLVWLSQQEEIKPAG
jgi:hypothetical protein